MKRIIKVRLEHEPQDREIIQKKHKDYFLASVHETQVAYNIKGFLQRDALTNVYQYFIAVKLSDIFLNLFDITYYWIVFRLPNWNLFKLIIGYFTGCSLQLIKLTQLITSWISNFSKVFGLRHCRHNGCSNYVTMANYLCR